MGKVPSGPEAEGNTPKIWYGNVMEYIRYDLKHLDPRLRIYSPLDSDYSSGKIVDLPIIEQIPARLTASHSKRDTLLIEISLGTIFSAMTEGNLWVGIFSI